MALKPASGKKCGDAAKNYSNKKDCYICTPAHEYADPCPNGTILRQMVLLAIAYLPMYVNGSAQFGGRLARFSNVSPKHSQLTQEQFVMQTQ
jgi:hypothetical protein